MPVQIIRLEQNWCILLTGGGSKRCLQGLAPKDWLRRERMVVARRMITGGQPPQEVAGTLGFSSPNNFRREFLVYHQVGPLEFRRKSWAEWSA